MNKLYTTLLIACLAAGFTACNDDDCEDLHLGNLAHYPNVLKGTFPTESQVLELGETLEITPELLNPEGATYSWLVNGKEYSTEPTFSYKIDNPCRADLTCIIKNKYGKVEMSTSFSSNHNFSKGFFYVADGTFNFYDTEKKTAYQDCYASLNAGKTLSNFYIFKVFDCKCLFHRRFCHCKCIISSLEMVMTQDRASYNRKVCV